MRNVAGELEDFYRLNMRNALVAELRRQAKTYWVLSITDEDHYEMEINGTVLLDDLADALCRSLERRN
jgi:uncharacterized protein YigA (DUF484 family)